MAIFPTTPVPSYNYELKARWKTVTSQADTGVQQRLQKQIQDLYDVTLQYNALSAANVALLWNFYQARKGSFEEFTFDTLESSTWENIYVGIGDGVTTVFDLPGKSSSSQSVFLNGAEDENVSFLTGGGTDSADRIVFTNAPGTNVIITCTFTGYMQVKCHFKEDSMSKNAFTYNLYRTGLLLEGLPR